MIRIIALAFLSFIAGRAAAQETACASEDFFQKNPGCTSSLRGLKCIELDIRHSVDKDGKEFIYSWNFGDGTAKRGYLTEYCYADFGTYNISLDLLDPVTSVVVRNELSTTITLLPMVKYQVDTVDNAQVNLRYDPGLLPGVSVEKVYWRVEDTFSCGPSTTHTFQKAGLHVFEIGVHGKQDGKNFSGCTLMGIYIKTKP